LADEFDLSRTDEADYFLEGGEAFSLSLETIFSLWKLFFLKLIVVSWNIS